MTTPFSGEPLTAPTYPSTLDEQLSALETDEWVLRFAESRHRLAATDPYRPLYHFSSPESYMNDPNGLCQWGRAIPHVLPVQADRRGPRPLGPHRQRRPRSLARHAPGAVPRRRARLLQWADARRVGSRDRDLPWDAVRERHRHRVRPAPDELAKAPPTTRSFPAPTKAPAPADTEYSIPASGKRTTATTLYPAPTRAETAAGTAWVSITSSARKTCPSGSTSAPCWKTPSSPSLERTAPFPTSGRLATTDTCCYCSATSAPVVTTSASTTTPRTASPLRLTDA